MLNRRGIVVGAMALALAGCSGRANLSTRSYRGPQVTRVVVMKARRRMYLMHHDQVLKDYEIDLGFAPSGPKQFEGDGKTPEGRYFIDRRNPESAFYLSLGVSYPNPQDIAWAESQGQTPGGDIFIHGQSKKRGRRGRDWTAGCISVRNREMREIFVMVTDGTPIDLFP